MGTRRALIVGITGQDGSYLAEHLLGLGYDVHGTVRTTRDIGSTRIGHLASGEDPAVQLHVADLRDAGSLARAVDVAAPSEVYNLAAQTNVSASFDDPVHTGDVNGLGALRVLEAVRQHDGRVRVLQASSSEMFGGASSPQSECTPFSPRNPYAVAKVYAHWATVSYRETHGIPASSATLFNHESPRRGQGFVTRKVTSAIPRLLTGEQSVLSLGNLDALRDWGHARDYVEAMHLMLQLEEPRDLVIGTGATRTVRDFVEAAFAVAGLDWERYVRVDPALSRPVEDGRPEADARLAHTTLRWRPRTTFLELVEEMVRADCAAHGVEL
jgi:GDPmannose 4,6-dehydratase